MTPFPSRYIIKVVSSTLLAIHAVSASAVWIAPRHLQTDNLFLVINSTSNLSTFNTLVKRATEPFTNRDESSTVFAPTNDGFGKLNGTSMWTMLFTQGYQFHLQDFVLFHMVANSTINSSSLPTDASNPPEVTLTMANMMNTTIGFVSGAAVFIQPNDTIVDITAVDIIASNGIIHTLGDVLLPKWWDTSIGKLISESKDYTTLASLLPIAFPDGLPSGILTVFAPTDSAFALMNGTVLENLKKNATELANLLLNHVSNNSVIPTTIFSTIVNVRMLSGNTIRVRGPEGGTIGSAMIGNATVTNPDEFANDGIVHGINEVMMASPTPAPTSSSVLTTSYYPNTMIGSLLLLMIGTYIM